MIKIKIINFEDDNYPEGLKNMKKPPKQLYVLGDETLLNKPNIAIVGSRNATPYGQIQAKRFAEELTVGGFNIVSGMAKGIDKISHEACIDAKDRKSVV